MGVVARPSNALYAMRSESRKKVEMTDYILFHRATVLSVGWERGGRCTDPKALRAFGR
jgi:hypothetical protein